MDSGTQSSYNKHNEKKEDTSYDDLSIGNQTSSSNLSDSIFPSNRYHDEFSGFPSNNNLSQSLSQQNNLLINLAQLKQDFETAEKKYWGRITAAAENAQRHFLGESFDIIDSSKTQDTPETRADKEAIIRLYSSMEKAVQAHNAVNEEAYKAATQQAKKQMTQELDTQIKLFGNELHHAKKYFGGMDNLQLLGWVVFGLLIAGILSQTNLFSVLVGKMGELGLDATLAKVIAGIAIISPAPIVPGVARLIQGGTPEFVTTSEETKKQLSKHEPWFSFWKKDNSSAPTLISAHHNPKFGS